MAIACLTPKLNPWVDVAILTTGLGLSSFSLAGMGSMPHLLFQGICSWSKKHLMSGSVGIMFWSCIIYWYVERMHYCHNGNLISRHFCVLQYEDLRVILMNWVWMQHSGLYCTHQDISPKYASILLVSFFSYSLQFAYAHSIRYLTLKGPRGPDVIGGVISYFLILLVKNVKIDLVYNDPIYHMYNSNQNIHICKLNYGEIWACINEQNLNTYDAYLINHSCHIWLDLHFLF